MKVSRRSWHYKLWNYYRNFFSDKGPYLPGRGPRKEFHPTSLCSYFWQIVGLSIVIAVLGIVAGIIALFFFPAAWVYDHWIADRRQARRERKRRARKAQKEEVVEEPKEKRPNLVVSYLAARKSKVCPIIELVD